MTPDENDINPVAARPQPAAGLVRWILVVTLGCSLGLLIVFVVLSARVIPPNRQNVRVVYHPRQNEAPFNLTEEPLEKELTRVVESQLAAFRNEDYPQAYGFAATALKEHIPLPAFERMVKHAYPFIAQSHSAQFGVVLDNGDQALVNATIVGTAGQTRHYQYILLRERNGWRISGVVEVKQTGTTI